MTSSGLKPEGRAGFDRATFDPCDEDNDLRAARGRRRLPFSSDNSIQTGAWSLAPGSPRTVRSTPGADHAILLNAQHVGERPAERPEQAVPGDRLGEPEEARRRAFLLDQNGIRQRAERRNPTEPL
jgi:hypothetical protein